MIKKRGRTLLLLLLLGLIDHAHRLLLRISRVPRLLLTLCLWAHVLPAAGFHPCTWAATKEQTASTHRQNKLPVQQTRTASASLWPRSVFTDAHLGQPLPADASPSLCLWRSETLLRVNQSRGFSCIYLQHRSRSKKANYMTASPAFIFFPPATQSRQQTVPTPVLCHHRRWPALWRWKYKNSQY